MLAEIPVTFDYILYGIMHYMFHIKYLIVYFQLTSPSTLNYDVLNLSIKLEQ